MMCGVWYVQKSWVGEVREFLVEVGVVGGRLYIGEECIK